jgi:hypothetical protein
MEEADVYRVRWSAIDREHLGLDLAHAHGTVQRYRLTHCALLRGRSHRHDLSDVSKGLAKRNASRRKETVVIGNQN